MHVWRDGAGAARLPSGDVLVAGGEGGHGPLSSAELFDPETGLFEDVSNPMMAASAFAAVAPLPGGQVLIAGGVGCCGPASSAAQLYDPNSREPTAGTFEILWTSAEVEARAHAIAAPLQDGQVLIVGGVGSENHKLASAELFNPENHHFEAIAASMAEARSEGVAAVLPDGDVLIAGGGPTAELFDPETNTFEKLAASEVEERYGAVAAPLPSGDVLIAGGGPAKSTVERFNYLTYSFEPIAASMIEGRSGAVATALAGGEVFMAGGVGSQTFLSTSAELFAASPEAGVVFGGQFGAEVVGDTSAVQGIVVTNLTTEKLAISGVTLGGADPGDFAMTADGCAHKKLELGQTCTIVARFTPSATGERSATITLQDNEPLPTAIGLSGTGIAANSGPTGANGAAGATGLGGATGAGGPTGPSGVTGGVGSTGPMGDTGVAGATGTPGPAGLPGPAGQGGTSGVTGATGPRGPAGDQPAVRKLLAIACATVAGTAQGRTSGRSRCTSRVISTPTGPGAKTALRATLARNGRVVATGTVRSTDGQQEFLSTGSRPLPSGRYTLTITHSSGKRTTTTQESITVS
jgi:hypothetical protein